MSVILCGAIAMVLGDVGVKQPKDPTVPYQFWESNSVLSNGIRLHYWRTGGSVYCDWFRAAATSAPGFS